MFVYACICLYVFVCFVCFSYGFVCICMICMYLYVFVRVCVCVCIDMYLYVCILLFTSGWEIVGVFDWHTHIMIRRKWWGGMELGAVVTFTCTRTWCYTTRNFDMHLCTYLMLRYKWGGVGWAGLGAGKFYLYCPRTWCYARECSLTLAHVLYASLQMGFGQVK